MKSKSNDGDTWSRLADVVVAFDIDNTLLDADGKGYATTVAEFIAFADLGLRPADGARAYESLRSRGDALERLGLGNPIHDRAHPEALAVLCLTRGANRALLRDLEINPAEQARYQELVVKVAALESPTRKGTPSARLSAEIALRRFLATDPRVGPFRTEAKRIAERPRIRVWTEHFRRHERAQAVPELEPLMKALTVRGAVPVVITEGLRAPQDEKLKRAGLLEHFRGGVLITKAAAAVPGMSQFDDALAALIDIPAAGGPVDPELTFIWHYHCLIDSWRSKTPWFYGRCLHALQESPTRPEEVFGLPAFVEPDRWRKRPLRFIMIGDRYDKDIEPLVELLGPRAGLKLRLRMGKYGHRHPDDTIPAQRRADRTFTDWAALTRYLTEEATVEHIEPIAKAPDVVNRAEVVAEQVERGLDHPLEAIRVVAGAVNAMLQSRS